MYRDKSLVWYNRNYVNYSVKTKYRKYFKRKEINYRMNFPQWQVLAVKSGNFLQWSVVAVQSTNFQQAYDKWIALCHTCTNNSLRCSIVLTDMILRLKLKWSTSIYIYNPTSIYPLFEPKQLRIAADWIGSDWFGIAFNNSWAWL